MHNTKFSVYKIRVQFNNNVLVIEQNNFAAKILNAYIVYDLDDLPKISLKTFKLKYCLFGATDVNKIVIKVSELILATQHHLMVEVCGVLVLTLLRML